MEPRRDTITLKTSSLLQLVCNVPLGFFFLYFSHSMLYGPCSLYLSGVKVGENLAISFSDSQGNTYLEGKFVLCYYLSNYHVWLLLQLWFQFESSINYINIALHTTIQDAIHQPYAILWSNDKGLFKYYLIQFWGIFGFQTSPPISLTSSHFVNLNLKKKNDLRKLRLLWCA